MKKALALLVVVASCSPSAKSPTPTQWPATSAEITESDLRQRLFRITDDGTMGRETGPKGAFVVTDYIAAGVEIAGSQPGGEKGTWFQTVPMWTVAVDKQSTISANGKALAVRREFLPMTALGPARSFNGVSVVFGGSMRDTTKWIAPAAADGKVVLIDVPVGVSFRAAMNAANRYRGALFVMVAALDNVPAEQSARLWKGSHLRSRGGRAANHRSSHARGRTNGHGAHRRGGGRHAHARCEWRITHGPL